MSDVIKLGAGRQDFVLEIEAQLIHTSLTNGEWTLHGRRNRIFILGYGAGIVEYSGEKLSITGPCILWIPVGTMGRLTLYAGARGAWAALGEAVIGKMTLPMPIAMDLQRLTEKPQFIRDVSDSVVARLCQMLLVLEVELMESGSGAQEIIRNQLSVFLIYLWRISDTSQTKQRLAPSTLMKNFIKLVEEHVRNHWAVRDYADYLGVSQDRLNASVNRALGVSPLEFIHSKLMMEVRQLLESSSLSIGEIAGVLGFDDPAYFSRFCKRHLGTSPRQFRRKYIGRPMSDSGSFAAWP